MDALTWIGIILCLLHSAMFSGLNLGFFGVSRLKLFVQADLGNQDAQRILSLRKDAHHLLATLLWGNVASNVLITLLSDSILTGIGAFVFSTFGITLLGEIFPQAYLAKHALKSSIILVPIIKLYRFFLYPLAKPTALLLDLWLGKEKVSYFREEEIKVLLRHHAQSQMTDLENLETMGAINFLAIDDVRIKEEGEMINPKSIIQLETTPEGLPEFPPYEFVSEDPFLRKINASQEKWVILTNPDGDPLLVLDADQFLRDALYKEERKSIYTYCHRPIVVVDEQTKLGEVMLKFKVSARSKEDDVVDNDIILFWGREKKIVTGADILGRLLRGIVDREFVP
jgi:CBS domain containing-hemolysin-like protein